MVVSLEFQSAIVHLESPRSADTAIVFPKYWRLVTVITYSFIDQGNKSILPAALSIMTILKIIIKTSISLNLLARNKAMMPLNMHVPIKIPSTYTALFSLFKFMK